jgi:putative heme transporter
MAVHAMNRQRGLQVARGVLSTALVVGIFWGVLPRVADVTEVWATIREMTWLEISTLSAVAVWNLVSYWIVIMAVLPGLSLRRAAAVNLVGGAVSNTIPGGGAVAVGVTYSMLASWGFDRPAIARSVLLSGIWNTFVKLGLPVVALALLVAQRRASASLVLAAAVGVGVLATAVGLSALILRSATMAARVGERLGIVVSWLRARLRRPPVTQWGPAAVRFRAQTIDVVRGRWPVITGASVLSHMALYLVLLLTLRHVGVSDAEVGWVAVLGAFAFVRLLSALPITPGGLGVVELGLGAALILSGGDRAQVVAAVLVYRALTFLPAIPLGALVYLGWRRSPAAHAAITPAGPHTDAAPALAADGAPR